MSGARREGCAGRGSRLCKGPGARWSGFTDTPMKEGRPGVEVYSHSEGSELPTKEAGGTGVRLHGEHLPSMTEALDSTQHRETER
jgi:hypothetical protein